MQKNEDIIIIGLKKAGISEAISSTPVPSESDSDPFVQWQDHHVYTSLMHLLGYLYLKNA